MSLHGHVENGSIVLDESIALPDGTRVEIELVELTSRPAESTDDTSLSDRLRGVVGAAGEGLPADFAEQHDHAAHGTPTRSHDSRLLPRGEWERQFREMLAICKSTNPEFDDSRESLYPVR